MIRTALLVSALALALAPLAHAKGEPLVIEVCGPDRCVALEGVEADPHDAVDGLLTAERRAFELERRDSPGPPAFAGASPPAPYYEVRAASDFVRIGPRYLVLDHGLLVTSSSWIRLERETLAALGAATTGLEPFPAPVVSEATIDGKRASDPSALARLVERLEPAEPTGLSGAPVQIVLQGAGHRATPWSGDDIVLTVYAGDGLVRREDGWYRLPAEVASALADETDGSAVLVGVGSLWRLTVAYVLDAVW